MVGLQIIQKAWSDI